MISKYKEYIPEIGKGTYVAPTADVIGRCQVGKDSSIWFGAVVRADIHYIKIGARTSIQDLSVLHVTHYTNQDMSDGFPVEIGDDVTVGHKAMLHGCTIEDNCLIGMSAVLLDGCRISRDSIVAAGSVVTKNREFPPRSLIMGIPAKVVRTLTDEEVKEISQSAKNYVDYKNDYLEMLNK